MNHMLIQSWCNQQNEISARRDRFVNRVIGCGFCFAAAVLAADFLIRL